MKAEDLRNLSTEDLEKDCADLREELFNLRFRSVTEPVDDPHRVTKLRRQIARIKTIIREREIEEEKAAKAEA